MGVVSYQLHGGINRSGAGAVAQASVKQKKGILHSRARILKDDEPTGIDVPRMKIQVVFPNGSRIGPGKIKLLETIDEEGSLVQAARKLKISYRHAWLHMQHLNSTFSQAVVTTPENGHGGGPFQLTQFGRDVIAHYRALEKKARTASARQLAWLEENKTDAVAREDA